MTSRRRWSFVLAAAVMLMTRCAGGPTPSRETPPVPVTARPTSLWASPGEAEAALLALEDRRTFDLPILTAAAKAPEPETRARAAWAIGRLGDDRGRPQLRELLKDAVPAVRAAAAFACEPMGDPALTAELIPLLADPELKVATAAAKAIGYLARGDGQDALAAAIPSAASPELRAAMLGALWKTANAQTQTAALGYRSDPDARVRAGAIYSLARKPLESSLPALTDALSDSDPDTAAIAARALGILAKKDSLGPLASALDSGKTPLVINALAAMEAVFEKNPGASVSEEAKRRVLALAGDANGNIAAPALVLLRQFAGKDREIFRRLWSIATTGEGRRRQTALLSVVALLRAKADTAIQAAAASSDAGLRATAAESMAFLSAAEAKPYRDRFSTDRDPLVRLAAVNSLKTAETVQKNKEMVLSALTDPDSGVRAAAVDALGQLEDASLFPLLQDAAKKAQSDRTPEVPIAIIGLCEKIRSEAAGRALIESLYRQGPTLVARLARRCLVESMRADPSAFPVPGYQTGKTPADYAALLTEARKTWKATVETARGSFTIRLAGEQAPLTVMNFVTLAQRRFFDGVSIHRVVPNFVLQDGDPTGTGNGGPGYEIRDEINPIEYKRGTVGMALSGPDTGGSQWFITVSPQPHLDGIYTVFGQVVSGEDVVERIEQWDHITRVSVSAGP